MAVLVEGISVIVRLDAINTKFAEGWNGFLNIVPNQTLCADDDIARVGFMSPTDVKTFVTILERGGLTAMCEGSFVDIAVVDQLHGLTMPTEWLEFAHLAFDGTGKKVAACWLFADQRLEGVSGIYTHGREMTFVTPDGWIYEDSLSAGFKFTRNEDMQEELIFLRQEEGTDVYMDRSTGKEVYVCRPKSKPLPVPRKNERRSMRLYSYIVTHDTGFAPNPFWDFCTVANCKPAIRRTAQVGDWIVGLSPKARGNKIIYAMEVNEVLSYTEYYQDIRFSRKIPKQLKDCVIRCGDNIYEPNGNGSYVQRPNIHHSAKEKDHDLGGKNVLIATNFVYFGSLSIDLPEELAELKVLRGHKSNFDQSTINCFIEYMGSQPRGVCGKPTKWPKDDNSSFKITACRKR